MDAHPYFSNLPYAALGVTQAAWDRVDNGGFEGRVMFDILCKDLNNLGHVAPTRPEFNDWVKAIKVGDIRRPEAVAAPADWTEPAPTAQNVIDAAGFRSLTPADFRSPNAKGASEQAHGRAGRSQVAVAQAIPIRTEAAPEVIIGTVQSVPEDFARLGETLVLQMSLALQQDVQARAKRLVAEQLRTLAERLENNVA